MKGPLFLLRYRYVADVVNLRPALRPAHLELANEFVRTDKLLLGGALEPLEKRKGFLVFATKENAEEFAKRDPYVISDKKIVESFEIDQWNVVVGSALKKQ